MTARTLARRLSGWGAAVAVAAGLLALLSNQLLLGHRASGKSVSWIQAAAWAVPTLLAWCATFPAVLAAARRWPIAIPVRPARIATHVGLCATAGTALLVLHLVISWTLGWIPRDPDILRFELAMTGRSYAIFNLLAYWGILAAVSVRRSHGAPAATADPAIRNDPFIIKVGNRRVLVHPEEVSWAEAAGNYVRLHTPTRTHLVRMTLKELVARLDREEFVRIHRSVVVRRTAVRELRPRAGGDYDVLLESGTIVTLSRRYRAAALPRLVSGRREPG